MSGYVVLALFFCLIFLGVPVAYTLIFSSGLFLIFSDMSLLTLMQRMGGSMNSITLLAVPTFIFAGWIMNHGGLTNALFSAVNTSRICRAKGGLAYVNVIASLIFAGMSGAALADLGGLGNIEMTAMKENGYKDEDALGITLASSAIGPIFPPSIPLLVYALIASVSGIKILIAGIVPGILLTITLMIVITLKARKKNYPRGNVDISKKEKRSIQAYSLPAMFAPIILLGGLFSGFYSPSELACVAVVYSFVVGKFFYKKVTYKNFLSSARETTTMISNTMFILSGATVFAFVLTVEQIPQSLIVLLGFVADSKVLLILMINVILLLVGMVLDSGTATLIFTPIFLPLLKSIGMDPIQAGIFICLNLVIGLYTPPFGVCLFMATTMSNLPLEKVVKAIAPYYIPLFSVLMLVSFWSPLSMWLPSMLG
jgi:tripartite ATP-independent transporter DctM subunit